MEAWERLAVPFKKAILALIEASEEHGKEKKCKPQRK
jgi:hypothetical protein